VEQAFTMEVKQSSAASGFGRAWFVLTVAFALHVIDEATTGFLGVCNPTVTALRSRWLRPLAWLYAVIQLLNAMGHTVGTILGHTVASVTFPRPAPGFYSSPLLFIGSGWLMVRLRRTASIRSLSS
jgi:hypothetical protein